MARGTLLKIHGDCRGPGSNLIERNFFCLFFFFVLFFIKVFLSKVVKGKLTGALVYFFLMPVKYVHFFFCETQAKIDKE